LIAVKLETGPSPQLQQPTGSTSQSESAVQAWMSAPAPPPLATLPATLPVPPLDEPAIEVEPPRALVPPLEVEPPLDVEPPLEVEPARFSEPAMPCVPPAPLLSKTEPPHAAALRNANGTQIRARSRLLSMPDGQQTACHTIAHQNPYIPAFLCQRMCHTTHDSRNRDRDPTSNRAT